MRKTFLTAASTAALVIGAAPAFADQAPDSAPAAKPAATATTSDDIVVTSTRREERARDIAGSVSAVSGEQLQKMGAQSYADYLTRLPGVAFAEGPSGDSAVILRGISTTSGLAQGQGTTGYFINDIPLTEPGYATSLPDIDTFDVNRVEVLKGPQGTLFGSASLGGAVNYIANTADVTGYHAAFEGILGSTHNANGQLNYATKMMVNIPIIADKLAVRLVWSRRTDAGYLDNIGTGEKGSNDTTVQGVRGSIVFTPTEGTKITYLGMYQTNNTADSSTRYSDLGKYQRYSLVDEPFKFGTQLHNLRLDQDLGFATLTASGAFVHKTDNQISDYSLYSYYTQYAGDEAQNYLANLKSNTQDYEIRLASPKGQTFEWVVGAMHMHVKKSYSDYLYAENAKSNVQSSAAAAAAGLYTADDAFFAINGEDGYYHGISHTSGNESAIFGEGNLHFAQHFTLTAGGRLFKTDSSTIYSEYGIFDAGGATVGSQYKVKDHGFAPKVSLSYRQDGVMVYALASKGYRFGSPNTVSAATDTDNVVPKGTKSDSLWNYEVGTRIDALNKKLTLDLTAYYVDWKNLQLRLSNNGITYGDNAGRANIYGVDATITAHPVAGLTLQSNVTRLSAKLADDVSTSSGELERGQRLPSAAKWRISNTVSYTLDTPLQPTLTVMHRYVSSAPGYINEDTTFKAYNVFDARFGISKGQASLTAFIDNIGNKDAVTFGYGAYAGLGESEFIIRPRTYGIQFDWAM